MRNKIDYGIDLGTTNSAIARMENGAPTIKKSDVLKDTLPSCVHFNKKCDTIVGDRAVVLMEKDNMRALKTFKTEASNSYIEFKRTMGTTHQYESANMNKSFSSEELSAEMLKKLKSFILDENISSIVITVPAKFLNPQKEATMQAARLAGFKYVELLQEPVAAAIAYGLTAENKDSYWLVFDFGGGTFDVALIKSEEGILTVKDTEGDNWLGGKNLDEAIVDQIIISYLQDNYAIDSIIEDAEKREILRKSLKRCAEDAKIQLSFKDTYNILLDLDDKLPFEDENGEELEIDIVVTQKDMETVLAPIFQKTIDITNELLCRNNLKGSDLGSLILVGGPTHSPILRRMLKEQVTEKVDTSADPMTVVAKGAALFASTISIPEGERNRDRTKLQFDIQYEATSVETKELIKIEVLREQTIGVFPEEIYVDIVRGDGAWASGKKQIGEKATLIEVLLQEGCSNVFTVNVYDKNGDKLECQPNQFNILQGIDRLEDMSILPYNIGIGKWFETEEKNLFQPVRGLEKNKRIPATGVINGLKTRNEIRPGMASDIIRIPIYQGAYAAEGTNPDLNNLVDEVLISGESLPKLLPVGSDVDITIKVDRSEQMQFSAYFPLIDHTEELKIQIKQIEPPTEQYLADKINEAKRTARAVNAYDIASRLEELENQLKNERGSADGRMNLLDSWRKELIKLESVERSVTWPKVEKELKEMFFDLEDFIEEIKRTGLDEKLNINRIDAIVQDIKQRIDAVIREQNVREAKELITEIKSLGFNLQNEVTGGAMDVQLLQDLDRSFGSYHWKNPTKARQLINQGLQQVASGNKNIRPLLVEISGLMSDEDGERFKDTLNTLI